jgi:hypothetical protein
MLHYVYPLYLCSMRSSQQLVTAIRIVPATNSVCSASKDSDFALHLPRTATQVSR